MLKSDMDAISPPIRLDNENDLRAIEPYRDWEIDEEQRTAFYIPGQLLFVIAYPARPLGGSPPLTEVTARLAHLCDGAAMPALDQLQRVGKDAIHAFVAVAGDFLSPLAGGWPVLPDGPPVDYSQPITDEEIPF